MPKTLPPTIDFVRELRLRQWARQHYVPSDARKSTWHPVVLDEMHRRDEELADDSPHIGDPNPETGPLVANVSLEVHGDSDEPMASTEQKASSTHAWHAGSTFVPLAPTSNWERHPSSSTIPKPHDRLQNSDHFECVETSDFDSWT